MQLLQLRPFSYCLRRRIYTSYFESNDPSQIKIDGNISDWNNIEKIAETDSLQTENSNIDITEISMNLDSIYLSLYTQTKEPLFISIKLHIKIFVDTDNNVDTGYFPE